ncbi:extracellular matrix protein 3-like [Tropilaelaps mercedesae]|uniref:Extracellular matrix protein 3-like n=1 Tax=Tropilaelaps mercedesae TaxID=418985 RepID=A0A1V9XH55_9ACAR|nr:extracellular matrix protein 3-like [Tropilaelaps mercedesae]
MPMSLDRDQMTVSLEVEVPRPVSKDPELIIHLADSRGCLAHPSTRRVIPKEKLRSVLVFEHNQYTVQEPNDGTITVYIKVSRIDRSSEPLRFTAVTAASSHGFSSVTGSALPSIDFEPLNQEFEFVGSSRSLLIPLKIVGDREQENDETLYVLLKDNSSQKTMAKTSVTIIDGGESRHLQFISAPAIVSLRQMNNRGSFDLQQQHQQSIEKGHSSTVLNRGYPIQCITECDERHPHYAPTSLLCAALKTQGEVLQSRESDGSDRGPGFTSLSLSFRWKWALHASDPLEPLRRLSRLSANATQPDRLESFYLVPGSRLSCSVRLQLAPKEGSLGKSRGEERESEAYHVSDKGVCPSPKTPRDKESDENEANRPANMMEPYNSSLRLVEGFLAPRFELSVSIPHQDGLVPLISTFPILKEDYSFSATPTATLMRHPCSNFANISMLHSSLSLFTCKWHFSREFSLDELRSMCGAIVDVQSVALEEIYEEGRQSDSVSSENVRATEQTSTISLSLPLHVAYLQRTPCPSNSAANNQLRWNHASLSNVLQLSFLYDKRRLGTDADHKNQLTAKYLSEGASVEVDDVRLSADGILRVRFRSNHFLRTRGRLVLHRERDYWNSSTVWITSGSAKTPFRVQLERTLSDNEMEWILQSLQPLTRFSSNISLSMYPCIFNSDNSDETSDECRVATENRPLEFLIPIDISAAFGSVDRYSLISVMSLTKRKDVWLQTYNKNVTRDQDATGNRVRNESAESSVTRNDIFARGDVVYGKVGVVLSLGTTSPIFRANIERCYLCSSMEESVSTRLPLTGQPCADHSRMSCVFKILDSVDPYSVDASLGGSQFGAVMMSQDPTSFDPEVLEAVREKQRADGFLFRAAPLFEDAVKDNFYSHGEQDDGANGQIGTRTFWHVHCVFTVDHEEDSDRNPTTTKDRQRRSATFGIQPRLSSLRSQEPPSVDKRSLMHNADDDVDEDDIRESSALLLLDSYDDHLGLLGSGGPSLWNLLLSSLQHSSSSPLPLLFFFFAGCIVFLIILLLLLSAVRFAKRAPRYQPPLKTVAATNTGTQITNANNNHHIVTMHVFSSCEEQSNRKNLKKPPQDDPQEKILYPPASPQSPRHIALVEFDTS